GAVGTAEWTGTPLAAVLERAGVQKGAVEVVLEGADTGEITEDPRSPGKISFARSIPIEKALQPDVLLAYRMNGVDLSPSHGFPVRAVVPGWYGMASVKWLVRIIVTDRPFTGYFQTADYAYWARRDGLPPQRIPVGEAEVKAQIARPARHEMIPAGAVYPVHGAAWGGETEVAKVEVSADGGHSWEAARWRSAPQPYCWRFWEYAWRTPERPGLLLLMARATDARGQTQPMERDPHRATYMISHVLPIPVEIVPPPVPSGDAWEI
ncbi:MAG TPA: molybdopterin-dependent oxidoreductase, partial [Chthonomonadaceae bacterium]|nr:molybdopterin-dependent oxidoreductase [Chthonomonadaceae bacterium]